VPGEAGDQPIRNREAPVTEPHLAWPSWLPSNTSFIARGRSSNGHSEFSANSRADANAGGGSQCRRNDDNTRTTQTQSNQRG
jgi:hypothetical protein